MLAKLALRNISRNIRSYTLYFTAIALSIALFYAFNSMAEAPVITSLLEHYGIMLTSWFQLALRTLSVFACVCFIYLLISANRYIVSSRQREFGMYVLLGMTPVKMSAVLLMEIGMVGICALIGGLVCGVMCSQLFSFATLILLSLPKGSFSLFFAPHACLFTCCCFLAVFLVAAVVNVIYLMRANLNSLLFPKPSHITSFHSHTALRVIVACLSVCFLSLTYRNLWINQLARDWTFLLSCIFLVIGSALFFASVPSLVLHAFLKRAQRQSSSIKAFTIRQLLSSGMYSTISATIICVLLFFASTTIAAETAFHAYASNAIYTDTPFSATITAFPLELKNPNNAPLKRGASLYAQYDGNIEAACADTVPGWSNLVQNCAQIDFWPTHISGSSLLANLSLPAPSNETPDLEWLNDFELQAISVGQFNRLQALMGNSPIRLSNSSFALIASRKSYQQLSNVVNKTGSTLHIAGQDLTSAGFLTDASLQTANSIEDQIILIVPDSVAAELKAREAFTSLSYLNLNYTCDGDTGDARLEEAIKQAIGRLQGNKNTRKFDNMPLDVALSYTPWPITSIQTSQSTIRETQSLAVVMAYLLLYFNAIMILSTGMLLTIKQVTTIEQNTLEYRRLSQIGCPDKLIHGSLFAQTAFLYYGPLGLALIHTTCGLAIVRHQLSMTTNTDFTIFMIGALVAFIALYSMYFYITYAISRHMIERI